jgi:toxin HigB-1
MIKDFKHKGLEKFYLYGSTKGIQYEHAQKIKIILTRLNKIELISDMDVPAFRLHQLKGDLKNHWSVRVNGNWRITFKFENGDIYVVNYQDYH